MDVERVRKDFPILETGVIYLDSAATALTPEPVLEKMMEYYRFYRANVHRGAYRLAIQATREVEEARTTVANWLGASPEEIVFTPNTTYSLNMVAMGIEWRRGDRIVTTNLEHNSNFLPWQEVARKYGVELVVVKSDLNGFFELSDFERVVNQRTRLVTVTGASNVLGVKPPIKEIGSISKDFGAFFCVDAAALAGHAPIDVKEIKADFVAISGHKGPLGPPGTGILFVRREAVEEGFTPSILGGGTVENVTTKEKTLAKPPERFEPGTPNIAGIIALGRSVRYIQDLGIKNIERHEQKLLSRAVEGMLEIEGVSLLGPESAENRVGILSFQVEGLDPHDIAIILDETSKICIRSGKHCAHILFESLGKKPAARASFALYNTEQEVDQLVGSVEQIVKHFT